MTALKQSLDGTRPCIDCGRATLGSLDAAGLQPICWRPCWHARQNPEPIPSRVAIAAALRAGSGRVRAGAQA